MNLWYALTDSDSFRRATKSGPGRAVLGSRVFRRANIERNRIRTAFSGIRRPDEFASVRTFCCFVGHNKSGTSMVGGLLDAHPRVLCSDEVDAFQYVDAGFRRDQLFHVIAKGSRAELRKGRVTARRLQPYSYFVPGQWQGRSDRPLVVGDSTSGKTTRRLGEQPELLDRVRAGAPAIEVKLLHVVRNPFDPISVMMVRGRRTFANAIEHYFSACRSLATIRRHVAGRDILLVRHEEFVATTAQSLRRICAFVGVDAEPAYLDACSAIIRDVPDRSRTMVEWTPRWIAEVEQRIADVDFLAGYSYDN